MHSNPQERLTKRAIRRPKVSKIVAEDLLQRIGEGEFKAGDMLTPEYQLADEYGVSRGTIRTALQELVSLGVIITRHGTGSYVTKAGQDIHFNICDLTSMSDIIRSVGIDPDMKYLSRTLRGATKEEAQRLEIDENGLVLALKREVQTDGKMAIFSFDCVRADILPKELDIDTINGSLFHFLKSLNYNITSAAAEISANNGKDFGLNGEAQDECFIGLSQLHYDDKDLPIFYSQTYFRNALFSFSLMRRKR